MKIQCNVCEKAEATVLCCADEAALCENCDRKVHAANKLASKHHRLSLSHSSSYMTKCDICQETVGYLFCLEDRALLCRKCDIAIHTANSYVSAHHRFLLTGVKVGLESAEPGSSSSGGRTQSVADNRVAPKRTVTQFDRPSSGQNGTHPSPSMAAQSDKMSESRMSFAGGSVTGNLSQWPIDEFLAITDFPQSYGFTDNGSSKADSGKLGSTDSSSMLRSLEDDIDSDEQLGQVPDVWSVPKIPSPPTASGIHWPKSSQLFTENADNTVFVPDISWSSAPNYHQYQPKHNAGKRRRQS